MSRLLPVKLDSYKPLREVVYETLREAIRNGALTPGERLMEIQLAEELGVSSANVDEQLKSPAPAVQRLLGVSGNAGKNLGLDEQWALRIVKQVGNYAESFERNVGQGSPLKIERGLNALWRDGGLMYPLPIR